VETLLVPALVALTATAAWLLGGGPAGRRPASLRAAIGFTLGAVGAGVLFFLANLALGMTAVLVLRAVAPGLVSLYPLTDQMLAILSALEGLVFYVWWTAER
jgi:hypothetical protein